MEKVAFFVDGFNFYHAINGIAKNDRSKNYLKWVDLRSLFGLFLDKTRQEIADIYFFTARPTHIKKKQVLDRYDALIKVYESFLDIKVIKGKFKKKMTHCTRCKRNFEAHEEKQSDVNLCLYMLRFAFERKYDCLYLVSRDSDMAPVASIIKKQKLAKLRLLTPPELDPSSEISKIIGRGGRIKEAHLKKALLKDVYTDERGKIVVKRPSEYDPPTE